jgi:hypothetical protein
VAVLVAVCEAVLLVLNCAAALCVDTNPIAVAATIASAVITNDVLFMCIPTLYNNNEIILIFVKKILRNILYLIIIIFSRGGKEMKDS